MDTYLSDIISRAYQQFKRYTLQAPLAVCHDCCLSQEHEQLLLRTPLTELDQTTFSLYFSAASTGDIGAELAEIKYFLPRMMEMLAEAQEIYMIEEVILRRLHFNRTELWPQKERELVELFALAYFDNGLIHNPPQDSDKLTTALIMFALGGMDITPLLQLWQKKRSLSALLHLHDFVVAQIDYTPGFPTKLTHSFSNKPIDETVFRWLSDSASQKAIKAGIYHHVEHNRHLSEQAFDDLSSLDQYLDVFYKTASSSA
jgi:hypothetical protein